MNGQCEGCHYLHNELSDAQAEITRLKSDLEAARKALEEIATTSHPDWAMRKMARQALSPAANEGGKT